jgi:Arc/MetJ family transcription regulator
VNVAWTALVEDQVADAFAYIAAERRSAALRWFDKLVESVGSLSLLPDQGRMVPEADRESIREVLVPPSSEGLDQDLSPLSCSKPEEWVCPSCGAETARLVWRNRPSSPARDEDTPKLASVLVCGQLDESSSAYELAERALVERIAAQCGRQLSAGARITTLRGAALPDRSSSGVEGFVRVLQMRLGTGLLAYSTEFLDQDGHSFFVIYQRCE